MYISFFFCRFHSRWVTRTPFPVEYRQKQKTTKNKKNYFSLISHIFAHVLFVCLQMSNNKQYLTMLDQVLNLDGYYFSTTFDLTHTMQRLHNTSPDFLQMALHERVGCGVFVSQATLLWSYTVNRQQYELVCTAVGYNKTKKHRLCKIKKHRLCKRIVR